MDARPRATPPAGALRRLERWLAPGERDEIIGDLVQDFADRAAAGRRWNRAWFWTQTALFGASALAPALFTTHDHSGGSVMEALLRGARQAGRRLRHDWRFAAGVVLILAAGLGPAAAIVSVVDAVLMRPLAYANPEQLAMVRLDLDQLRGHPGLSPAEVIDLRRSGLLAAVETQTRLAEVSMSVGDQLVSLSQISMTTGMLPMLGVSAARGRVFREEDIPPMPPPTPPGQLPATLPPPLPQVGLLDYDTWQLLFGGEESVVGRTLVVDGRPTEIVGVLPRGFRLITGRAVPRRVDLYVPFRLVDFRNAWQFPTLARLPQGKSFAEVQASLDGLSAGLRRQYPDFYPTSLRFTIEPLLDDLTKTTRPALRTAVAGVLLLLLVACANATALVVARLRSRERDLAVQQALGASRGALATQVLLESAWLAAAATAVGSLLAVGTVAVIREVIPRTVPRWDQIDVGWSLILYAGGLACLALLVSGLFLVWKVSRTASVHALRTGSAQGGRAEGSAGRLMLAGSQIALTVLLAFGCVQLARSAANLRQVELGFDADVLTLRVPYEFRNYPSREARARLYQRIRDRVAQVPGVTAVGVSTHVPLSGATMMDGYEADLSKEPSFAQAANYQGVTPGYFNAMRIPFLQGRDFTDEEDAGQQAVVVVDETLVRTVFPGQTDVIGRTLRLGWGLENARIIGVVGHARSIEVGRAVRPQIYASVANLFQMQNGGTVIVRATGNALSRRAEIEAAIREVGPGRAVGQVAMLSDNVTAAMSTLVAVTGLVTLLAVMAAALSAVGLYVVVAYLMHEQRRSAAIRTALGATRRQLIRSQLKTGGVVTAGAVAAGLLLAIAGAPLFGDLLYGVTLRDAGSLAGATMVTVAVSAAAMYLPARRAARANIVKILREA